MEILFEKGKSAVSYPLKCVFLEVDTELPFPAQAMFVAPKRNFKRAHDRNKLKRRMREAYRLNKASFYTNLLASDKKFILAFIYVGKKQEPYLSIEKSVIKQLKAVFEKDSKK